MTFLIFSLWPVTVYALQIPIHSAASLSVGQVRKFELLYKPNKDTTTDVSLHNSCTYTFNTFWWTQHFMKHIAVLILCVPCSCRFASVAVSLLSLAPFSILPLSHDFIYVQVNVFHKTFRCLSPTLMMAVPKCYFFSIYTLNIRNKESKGQHFQLG